jgi:hypothetical protein
MVGWEFDRAFVSSLRRGSFLLGACLDVLYPSSIIGSKGGVESGQQVLDTYLISLVGLCDLDFVQKVWAAFSDAQI